MNTARTKHQVYSFLEALAASFTVGVLSLDGPNPNALGSEQPPDTINNIALDAANCANFFVFIVSTPYWALMRVIKGSSSGMESNMASTACVMSFCADSLCTAQARRSFKWRSWSNRKVKAALAF